MTPLHVRQSKNHIPLGSHSGASPAVQMVGISPARVVPFLFRRRRLPMLTHVHVSDGWVYASTQRRVTYLWSRAETFFDVDIDRRVINIAARDECLSLSGQLFSLRKLRELHSVL